MCSRPKTRSSLRGRAPGDSGAVETSPEDIHGMHAAEGIVTTRGGMTSHAAVVARGMGKPCVSAPAPFASTQRADDERRRRHAEEG